jgi:hypothetical protein
MILIVLALCHGRGRGFEPRRPRQILKDLSPVWHVAPRYKKVQVQILALIELAGQHVLGQEEAPATREPPLLFGAVTGSMSFQF